MRGRPDTFVSLTFRALAGLCGIAAIAYADVGVLMRIYLNVTLDRFIYFAIAAGLLFAAEMVRLGGPTRELRLGFDLWPVLSYGAVVVCVLVYAFPPFFPEVNTYVAAGSSAVLGFAYLLSLALMFCRRTQASLP